MSEESRKKMSLAKKGVKRGPRSEETKEKIRQASLGKKVTPETKEKMKQAKIGCIPWNKGKAMSDACKEKLRKFNTGKTLSLETKEKIRETFKSQKINVGSSNPMSIKVLCIETGVVYDTVTKAAKEANVSISKVSKCINGGNIVGPFHWVKIIEEQ